MKLEIFSLFLLNLKFKVYAKVLPNYQSDSRLQSPSSKGRACKEPKIKILMNDSVGTVWMF